VEYGRSWCHVLATLARQHDHADRLDLVNRWFQGEQGWVIQKLAQDRPGLETVYERGAAGNVPDEPSLRCSLTQVCRLTVTPLADASVAPAAEPNVRFLAFSEGF
jgi:hypothetical protein